MFKNMKYVYSVYKHKSFTKAAEDLYISQPSLSATIKKLENKFGIPLFDRSTSPIQLTQAGEAYIKAIEKIMAIENELEQTFNNLKDSTHPIIRLGSASFFCAYVLPPLVQHFHELDSSIEVKLVEANADDLGKNLQTGVVDLIVDVEHRDTKQFESVIWKEESIVLAVPAHFKINDELKNYQLSFDEVKSGKYLDPLFLEVNLSHFNKEDFILLREGNNMHNRALTMCRRAGFEPKVTMYLDQLLTSYYLSFSGKGISFIRADITNYVDPTNNLCFYKIADEHSKRNIMLYFRKNEPLTSQIQTFINYLVAK